MTMTLIVTQQSHTARMRKKTESANQNAMPTKKSKSKKTRNPITGRTQRWNVKCGWPPARDSCTQYPAFSACCIQPSGARRSTRSSSSQTRISSVGLIAGGRVGAAGAPDPARSVSSSPAPTCRRAGCRSSRPTARRAVRVKPEAGRGRYRRSDTRRPSWSIFSASHSGGSSQISPCIEQHLELPAGPDLVQRRAEALVEPFHAVG